MKSPEAESVTSCPFFPRLPDWYLETVRLTMQGRAYSHRAGSGAADRAYRQAGQLMRRLHDLPITFDGAQGIERAIGRLALPRRWKAQPPRDRVRRGMCRCPAGWSCWRYGT